MRASVLWHHILFLGAHRRGYFDAHSLKNLAGTPLKGRSQAVPLIILSDFDCCQAKRPWRMSVQESCQPRKRIRLCSSSSNTKAGNEQKTCPQIFRRLRNSE